MFVLQECSICFEDYDDERQPHSIPCGHVFCQPCLESLVSNSPQCPNCRVSYASASIRKVICNLQDQGTSGAAQVSEAETLMWQAIQSAVESPQDLKQSKSIVQNNPEDALLAAGMNKNVLASLTLMRLLVQAEEKSSSLNDKLNTSWAVEESLRDQISRLEAKLSLAGNNTCPSSEHFKVLLADVRNLQSVVDAINKNTSEFSRHLSAKSETPASQARPSETPERKPQVHVPPPTPTPVPEPAPVPALKKQPSRPGILRKSPPQDTNNSVANLPVESPVSLGIGNPFREPLGPTHHRYPSTPTPTRQLMSPPTTPAILPEPLDGPVLFGQASHVNRWKSIGPPPNNAAFGSPSTEQHPYLQNPPMTRHLSMAAVPTSNRTQMAHLSMPVPSVLMNATDSTFVHPRPAPTPTPSQPSSSHSVNRMPLPVAPIPASTPQSRPKTLTAVFAFTASSSTELSLRNGQKLYLIPESDTNKDWIWCRDENGTAGYVPKSYVKVDGA